MQLDRRFAISRTATTRWGKWAVGGEMSLFRETRDDHFNWLTRSLPLKYSYFSAEVAYPLLIRNCFRFNFNSDLLRSSNFCISKKMFNPHQWQFFHLSAKLEISFNVRKVQLSGKRWREGNRVKPFSTVRDAKQEAEPVDLVKFCVPRANLVTQLRNRENSIWRVSKISNIPRSCNTYDDVDRLIRNADRLMYTSRIIEIGLIRELTRATTSSMTTAIRRRAVLACYQ